MSEKIMHLILLILLVLIGGIICLYCKVDYLTSILFFAILPSTYLSVISRKTVRKAALFSLAIIGIPLVIDGLLIINNAWSVETIFSFKVINLIPIEDFFFSFFSIYLVVMVYEYFIKSNFEKKDVLVSKKLAIVSILAIAIFLYLYFTNPSVLYISYAYVSVFFFVGFIPIALFSFLHLKLLKNFLTISIFYFFFALFYEIVALKIGVWAFPGTQYIAMISLFGVQFPFEEFIFFLVLFPIGILTYYELFTYENRLKN